MSVAKTVEDLGTELGERIAATDEYQRFEEAKAAVAGIRSDAARWLEVATELSLLPIAERQVEVF